MAEHVDTTELSGLSEQDDDVVKSGVAFDAATADRSSRRSLLVSGVVVAALAALVGWLGYRGYEPDQTRRDSSLFLAAGRQAALNLTTIDYTRVDADMQRILDSSTGAFRDDFAKRSAPFVAVVKKAQSKAQGSIAAAGIQSQGRDEAQVLVAVTVKTSTLAGADPEPRSWRMRITVQKTQSDLKVSDVQFVP